MHICMFFLHMSCVCVWWREGGVDKETDAESVCSSPSGGQCVTKMSVLSGIWFHLSSRA